MLSRLEISNLAIIEKLSIDFSKGFNVLTGETGAGKSILIKGLQILLGNKIGPEIIRNGADSAAVTGLFEVECTHASSRILAEFGISNFESNQILIRKVLPRKGRAQTWINDTLVTSAAVKKIGGTLIDIFGQNESSKLLDPSKHVYMLDEFVAKKCLLDYSTKYQAVEESFLQLESLIHSYENVYKKADYLSYRKAEFDDFSPSADDYHEVLSSSAELNKRSKQKEVVIRFSDLLNAQDGLISKIADFEAMLPRLESFDLKLMKSLPSIGDLKQEIENSGYVAEKWLSESQDLDEKRDVVEARISKYQDFLRKTNTASVDELVDYRDEIEKDLLSILVLEKDISGLIDDLPQVVSELAAADKRLKKERKRVATNICRDVAKELAELAMSGVTISVEFIKSNSRVKVGAPSFLDERNQGLLLSEVENFSEFSEYGREKPVIYLSSNPGELAKPLEKVASGGEVSRIMLALKRVLVSGGEACVLVFDEIDSGISGDVADKVGKKLKSLTSSFQIICISHLAQVASYADKHFKVSKSQRDQRTYTSIEPLSEKDSTQEIARIMSGEDVTGTSIVHAKSLKKKAREQFNLQS